MKHVFIGGCGRSGTTLLGSMIGTHSRCLATPESRFLTDIHRASLTASGRIDPERFSAALGSHQLFPIWGISPPAPDELASQSQHFAAAFEIVVRAYGRSVAVPVFDTWIDHTPANVNRAAMLVQLFPGAKLIHVVRDGRAVASSVMRLDWGPNTIAAAARWWAGHAAIGIAAESFFGPSASMRVMYEDLVENPGRTISNVFRFLGLADEQQAISGDGYVVPGYTAAQHHLIGQRPDPNRAEAWRNALTSRQIEIFESIAGDMMVGLGYIPIFGPAAQPSSQSERLVLKVREFARRRVINQVRYQRRLRRSIGGRQSDTR